MKKILVLTFCVLIGMISCSCKANRNVSAESYETENIMEYTETVPETTDSGQSMQRNPAITPDADSKTVLTEFESILSGDGMFYIQGASDMLTINDYCDMFTVEADITKFALVDLDGDSYAELILWITVNENIDYGVLVLHYDNNGVHGYAFAYRQMMEIKSDGTFHWSGGASNNGTARIKFCDTYTEYDYIGGVKENDDNGVSFYWNGEEISEEVYEQFYAEQDAKESAEWFEYPCDSSLSFSKEQ